MLMMFGLPGCDYRMVELKNGETYSGVLASCDGFMNLSLARHFLGIGMW